MEPPRHIPPSKHAPQSKHAPSGKHALPSDHAQSSDHASLNNNDPNTVPMPSTVPPVELPLHRPQVTQQNTQQHALHPGNTASHSSPPTSMLTRMTEVPSAVALPYANLCPMAFSAVLQRYQMENGMSGIVYMVETTLPAQVESDTIPDDPIAANILSYALSATNTSAAPTAPSTADNKNDILTQGQMLCAPDKAHFMACQADEINTLSDMDIMDILPIAQLPPHARLVSAIWSYRQKRLPNGVLSKYKSRLCINGKEQALGRDYWETYAPVAAWSTICLLLYLSTLLQLKTRQVDYTSAFPQADLDVPVYMKVPQGWYVTSSGVLQPHHGPKHQDTANFLRLKKNFYGCKQAARNWFKLLSEGLHNLGFVQSATDSFLFLRSDCIIVVYVDDCLFFLSQIPLFMRSSTPYPKHLSLRTKVMFLHSSVS